MSTANALRYIGAILVLAGVVVAVRITVFQISEEPFDQLLTPIAAAVVLIGVGIYMFARASRMISKPNATGHDHTEQ
jgi:ABC-type nickel/cobalt efflux system permease component RcnA